MDLITPERNGVNKNILTFKFIHDLGKDLSRNFFF